MAVDPSQRAILGRGPQAMSSMLEQLLQDARTSVLESITSESISQSLVLLDHAWLEWHEKREEILRKVFSCSKVLNLDTATIWSGRALWFGADDLCPLKQIAMDFTRPLSVIALAWNSWPGVLYPK